MERACSECGATFDGLGTRCRDCLIRHFSKSRRSAIVVDEALADEVWRKLN